MGPQQVDYVSGKKLAQTVAQKAFKLYTDKKFRKQIDFSSLEQLEQDRIFNELVLAGLTLVMITCEAPDLRVDSRLKEHLLMLKDQVGWAYIQQLAELGIERKYLKDWEKLIGMRYEEYSNDKREARIAAMELEADEGRLDNNKLMDIQLVLPVQTVAIGCHHHICRGKTADRNELFKLLLRWLGEFYLELRVPIEGGKITMFKKIKVKLRRMFH